jgi:AraC-like DNA-binding protein
MVAGKRGKISMDGVRSRLPSSIEGNAQMAAEHAHIGLGASVWNAPGLRIDKSRSWQQLSAVVGGRPAGEGYWRSDLFRVALNLSHIAEATVRIENGPTQVVKPAVLRPLTFTPAGVGMTLGTPILTACQIHQQPETYTNLASEIAAPVGLAALEPFCGIDDPEMARLVQAIADEIEGGFLDHLLVNALNTALAVKIARHFHGSAVRLLPPGRLSSARLRRVVDYIEAHLDDALSVTEMASIACLSPFHFSRCFKRSTGMGLHRYVVARRIERAQRLLLETEMPLVDVAAAAGFESQSSFTSRFRRELGVTPGGLRRRMA